MRADSRGGDLGGAGIQPLPDHKAVMHADRLFLADWLPLEGVAGLAVYGASSCAVAGALYLLIERPFLRF
ncbi:MAG: hypothetical protein ACJ8AW_25175, partial [Rhodopila sp.]